MENSVTPSDDLKALTEDLNSAMRDLNRAIARLAPIMVEAAGIFNSAYELLLQTWLAGTSDT